VSDINDLRIENVILRKKNTELNAIWQSLDARIGHVLEDSRTMFRALVECKKAVLEARVELAIKKQKLLCEECGQQEVYHRGEAEDAGAELGIDRHDFVPLDKDLAKVLDQVYDLLGKVVKS